MGDGPGDAALASWLELSASALRHNVDVFRSLGGGDGTPRPVGVVLKGNAYGHGLAQVLPLVHGQVDILYFIAPQDALKVREYERAQGLAPRQVVVLGGVSPREAVALAREGVDVVVADRGWVDALPVLREAGLERALRVHVHIDTGLGREGFTLARLPDDVDFLAEARDVLEVVGVLSHFSNTEDVTEQGYALAQVDAFETGVGLLRQRLGAERPLQRHIAASAAALVLPRARYETQRVGISLYGLWPSPETRLSARLVLGEVPVLKPVLSWRCRSQAVKWLPSGSYVGYGCTYRTSEPTRIAVLPVGYYDGYPRLVSGKAHVLVNGRRCPVLGRVMMNHVIIDVTRATSDDGPVTATLLGRDGEESISAEALAGWAQTLHYELVTRLGAHLKRVVVE
ncbi:alanine racemase [Myxococcus stipitatus]|uniref:alanine racemase n=1 Tax=Myxococcus stipitatus TaxID=83455 RepID=UPI001F1B2DF2|nr:alanine racemase [Myxococcus stipitatus]MCE9671689.1 alanine racemase [Myxococcus stipitatus]